MEGRTLAAPPSTLLGSSFTPTKSNKLLLTNNTHSPSPTRSTSARTNSRGGKSGGVGGIDHTTIPTFYLLSLALEFGDVFPLAQLPIGLHPHDAPRQRMELFNLGDIDILFEIDESQFDILISDNFDMPIIRLGTK